MKRVVWAVLAAGVLSVGHAQANEALAKAKGCLACHAVEKAGTGPSYKDVAKKYAGQKGLEKRLAEAIVKGTGPAGVGWQKEKKAVLPFMPPNAAVKPEEADQLAKWILSLK